MKQYITLYENLSTFGLGNINILIDQLFKDKTKSQYQSLVEEVIKTCKKTTSINDENFILPKGVKFTEQPISHYLSQ